MYLILLPNEFTSSKVESCVFTVVSKKNKIDKLENIEKDIKYNLRK